MFDMDKFKKRAGELVSEASRKIQQYTPETFSPEKKYINAMVSSIALMVVADKKVETDEVTDAMEFIQNLDEVVKLEMTQDAVEMFEYIIEEISPHFDNKVKFITSTAKILGNIGLVRDNPTYVATISEVLDHIAGSDGNVDETEKEMKAKIMKALGQ